MQAIILAGGHGRKLYAPSTGIAKPMLPLFDRPVLEHTITLLARHGIRDIILSVSYESRDIIAYFGNGCAWGVNIRYSVESDPLGTAGAVKRVQKFVNQTLLVISGDAVTDFDIQTALNMHKSASAIATVMLSPVDEPSDYGLVDYDEAGKITRIIEKPRINDIFSNIVSTGIYILEPEALSCIPYNQVCDFSRDVFPRMLTNMEPVYGFSIPGYWCDVGNPNNYRNAHFDALQQKLRLDLPAVHIGSGVWLGERVDIHPSVELASPIFIGNGVTLKQGTKIGEKTVLGAGTWVDESSYISRSIIGSKSLIGKGARVINTLTGVAANIPDGESMNAAMLLEHVAYEPIQVKPTLSKTGKQTQTPRTSEQAAHDEQMARLSLPGHHPIQLVSWSVGQLVS